MLYRLQSLFKQACPIEHSISSAAPRAVRPVVGGPVAASRHVFIVAPAGGGRLLRGRSDQTPLMGAEDLSVTGGYRSAAEHHNTGAPATRRAPAVAPWPVSPLPIMPLWDQVNGGAPALESWFPRETACHGPPAWHQPYATWAGVLLCVCVCVCVCGGCQP